MYMSPEQLDKGAAGQGYLGTAVDVWAAGVLLIVMLLGMTTPPPSSLAARPRTRAVPCRALPCAPRAACPRAHTQLHRKERQISMFDAEQRRVSSFLAVHKRNCGVHMGYEFIAWKGRSMPQTLATSNSIQDLTAEG